ncbi:rubrerythrin family protein [Halorarius litoreus]|uniref:rubrerythrin family protein n=1 Tax=Halorarius litoreus TaxID=2962676 RepID=UPI0020CD9C85|nr:rubrerythrin family protein [Halorarius litoreus]
MTPEEFLDAVRTENKTALSRLGSSKSLYADTQGEMEADAVLTAAADAEYAAYETFDAWADDTDDAEAAEVFAATAAEEQDHYERVASKLDAHEPSDEVPAIQRRLREFDTTLERLGGLVGRTVAAGKSKDQLTGFFVGQADPKTAQLFREVGGDLDGQLDRATEALAAHCEDETDWQTALDAATAAIQAAYEEYTERLESMGVNPKPVC